MYKLKKFLIVFISILFLVFIYLAAVYWGLPKYNQIKEEEYRLILDCEYEGIKYIYPDYYAPYDEYIKNGLELPPEAFEEKEVPLIFLGKIQATEDDKVFEAFSTFRMVDRSTLTDWIFADSIRGKFEAEDYYGIQIPMIDFRTQGYVFSLGREIKKLTYTEATCYRDYDVKYFPINMNDNGISHQPVGVPIMSKEYYPSTVFIYWYKKDTLAPNYLYPSWFYDTLFIMEE